MELGSTRLCFNMQQLEVGIFNVASFDGELLHAQYNKPEGDEHSDYVKSSIQVCDWWAADCCPWNHWLRLPPASPGFSRHC